MVAENRNLIAIVKKTNKKKQPLLVYYIGKSIGPDFFIFNSGLFGPIATCA